MTLKGHITFLLSTPRVLVLILPSLMSFKSLIKRILPVTLDGGIFGTPTTDVHPENYLSPKYDLSLVEMCSIRHKEAKIISMSEILKPIPPSHLSDIVSQVEKRLIFTIPLCFLPFKCC